MTTAIVVAANGQDGLTALCLDAIRKFTPERHMVVLVTTVGRWARPKSLRSAVLPGRQPGRQEYRLERSPVWPWYSSSKKYAGLALSDALEAARASLRVGVDAIFFMHNDALPVRHGWLSYLKSRPYKLVGVKPSERNGAPHSSGVLFDAAWLASLPKGVLHARMPKWDVAEYPASLAPHWSAHAYCHRPKEGLVFGKGTEWWAPHACDVSYDEASVFYLHRGGGSWLGGIETEAWIAAARKGLGL